MKEKKHIVGLLFGFKMAFGNEPFPDWIAIGLLFLYIALTCFEKYFEMKEELKL